MAEREILDRGTIGRTGPGGSVERQEVTHCEPWRVGTYEWRCAVDLPFMNHAPFEIPSNDPRHAEKQARRFADELMGHHGWRRVEG